MNISPIMIMPKHFVILSIIKMVIVIIPFMSSFTV